MMTDNADSLVDLHNKWLRELDTVIEAGATPDDATESLLTIAISGRMRLDGPRATAARLAALAGMLHAIADQAIAEGRSDERTRH